MSPRTWSSVGNWCFYEISLVHTLFSTVFYISNHTSVRLELINTFLGIFIDIFIGFKMSPRTLNAVENRCCYKISLVHLLFSTVFYVFNHISIVLWPINTLLDIFIYIFITFKKSPRTLNSVRNWCFYKINLVHLLFQTVFYIFNHISVSFGPINMFLGTSLREFEGLQKTGLNRSRPVHFNRSFCGLYISKMKRPDRRSGLLQSWSGLVTVFFQSRDRTSKH